MKIVIPGGSGQIGTLLARAFVADGHEVVVLSRKAGQAAWRIVEWDGETLGRWVTEFDGADAVINLAGRSVNCRYGFRNRHEIKESRVKSTRAVGQAIAESARPPRTRSQILLNTQNKSSPTIQKSEARIENTPSLNSMVMSRFTTSGSSVFANSIGNQSAPSPIRS